MIKNLPNPAKTHLLKIFNTLFISTYFPEQWKHATVIPVHKTGKDPTKPTNYRPVALTSCLRKLFERMLNERLIDFLIQKNILADIQCGCLCNRSTVDHLARLESQVKLAFSRQEIFLSVFFDI